MKKLFFTLSVILFTCAQSWAQSCCKKPSDMQALALNKSFMVAHQAPEPLNYSPEKGSMITFPASDGHDGSAFYIPSDKPSDMVLLVFHEWWGLNDYIKREAENWHRMLGGKVSVYAIDLYDGLAATDAATAGKLMGGLSRERGMAIVNGALAKIGPGKHIATLGWCMGGSWSFNGAVAAGKEAVGCVMYYGFPETEEARIKPLKCDVLYIYGTKDDFIKRADVTAFEKKVQVSAKKDITVISYPAVHAFANPSNPNHDAPSAEAAQREAEKFLKRKLGLN